MIEQLVPRVLATRNAAHQAHWKTNSYAQHVALNEFYDGVLEALDEIGYTGMLSVEAFSSKLSAAHIWRKMFESENQLITESLAYIKKVTL